MLNPDARERVLSHPLSRSYVAVRSFRINRQIRIPQVRLIDENGEQVGIVSTDDARRRADEAGLDLVEVSPQAQPPVCRILDFGKFKYDQRKKERGTGHRHHAAHLKELRVRPMIDRHDLGYRLKKGLEFLANGHKVQVVCIFRHRQLDHPELGYNVMREVADSLAGVGKVETPARLMGRRMTMLLTPTATATAEKPGLKAKKAVAGPKAAPKASPGPASSAAPERPTGS
jgi:translation initiation factor IF-3